MEKIDKFLKKYQSAIIIIICILSIYMISVFPPSGDDFNRLEAAKEGFGLSLERVARLYKTLNGRVLGNEISYIFIGRLSRTIFKTISLAAYFYLMMKIINIKKTYELVLILGSVILMPLPVFRQVLVWSSGFYNYLPPIILILWLSYIFIYHRRNFTAGQYIGVFLISLSACLFMENLSIYMIFFPALMALCFWNKDNKKAYLTSFFAAILGNVIMFLSPVYRKVQSGDDSYREVAEDTLSFVLDNWKMFSKYLLVFNIFIMVLFAIVLVRKVLIARKKGKFSLAILALANQLLLIPFSLINMGRIGRGISLTLHVSFYILILAMGIKEVKRKSFWSRLIVFSCLSMAISMGPLLFVSPVSARNFFTPIVFNIFIIISFLRADPLELAWQKWLRRIGLIAMALVFALYLVVYSVNWQTFKKRDMLMKEAASQGLDEVEIPAYPFKGFNGGYGTDSMGNFYYKKEQKDLKIKIID